MMIQDFDDFSLWVYYIVDEICQQLQPLLHRPGPAPTTASDSELSAMALSGECRGHAWKLSCSASGPPIVPCFHASPPRAASIGAIAICCPSSSSSAALSCRSWMWPRRRSVLGL